jgi:hypothetical protein
LLTERVVTDKVINGTDVNASLPSSQNPKNHLVDSEGNEDPICYLLVQGDDLDMIMDAINNDEDQLRLFFGVKALHNILKVCSKKVTDQLIAKFYKRFGKRLVHVLNYDHMEELMTEVLQCVLLLTQSNHETLQVDFVTHGIIPALQKYVNVSLFAAERNI